MAYVATVILTKGSITVDIAATKVEQDLQNKIIKIQMPVRKSNQDTTAPTTKIVDLKRIEHVITVYGFLLSDSTSTALEKREALVSYTTLAGGHAEAPNSIGMLLKSGDITLSWRGESITCNFDKIKFIDSSVRDQREGNPDKYELIMTLTKGAVR